MKKISIILMIIAFLTVTSYISFAQSATVDIIKQGLLGAGTGAIAGSVSGGKSENLWISALTGAGVNIVGGSLLDLITEGNNSQYNTANTRGAYYRQNTNYRKPAKRRTYTYAPPQQVVYTSEAGNEPLEIYKRGYADGYIQGYKDAVKELTGNY